MGIVELLGSEEATDTYVVKGTRDRYGNRPRTPSTGNEPLRNGLNEPCFFQPQVMHKKLMKIDKYIIHFAQ